MGNYRSNFIKINPGVKRPGKSGFWYHCAKCGKWCARSAKNIPQDQVMEVDHILPWKAGGSDDPSNLQPLCKPCNRSKSDSISVDDGLKTAINVIQNPSEGLASLGRAAFRQNKVLSMFGLNKR